MPQSNRVPPVILAIVLVVAAGAFLWYNNSNGVSSMATSTSATSTAQNTGGYTITQVPIPQAPDFKAQLQFASDVSVDIRMQLQKEDAIVVATLTKTPGDLNAWVNLGTLHKMAGDYQGAATIWSYVASLYPQSPAAYDNLGDLYQNFLKNYAKAESNFLAAIQQKPDDTNPYRALYEMYTSVYKVGSSAAEDILKKGIAANPRAVDLEVLLARYYKSQGRTADAKAEYDAAIQNANAQGQVSLAAEIQQEAAGL